MSICCEVIYFDIGEFSLRLKMPETVLFMQYTLTRNWANRTADFNI
jgi:hypothetical protein